MSYLATVEDIVADALNKAGEKTDGTSPYAEEALEHVQKLYDNILAGANEFDINLCEPWAWAKARNAGILILEPPVDVTVALVADSLSAAFSVAQATSLTGRYLKIADRPDWIRIADHIAGATSFTLDAAYADETGAALTGQVIKLDYDLDAASILRQTGRLRVARSQESSTNQAGFIDVMDLTAFNAGNPWGSLLPGVPTQAGIVFVAEVAGANVITLRFNRYPDQKTRVEYDYIAFQADLVASSTVLVPREHREVLSYGAAHKLLVSKNDTNAEYHLKATKAKIQAMINANRKTASMNNGQVGQFNPRPRASGRRIVTSGSN